jgi:hypothetical protein
MNATKEPEYEKNDQYQAENATESTPTIPIISIVAPSAAKQKDQQNNDQDRTHFSPSMPTPNFKFGRMIRIAPGLAALANAGWAVAARHFRPPNAASKPPPTAAAIPTAKYHIVSSL